MSFRSFFRSFSFLDFWEDVLTGAIDRDHFTSNVLTNGTDDLYISDEWNVRCIEQYDCDNLVIEDWNEELQDFVVTGGSCNPSTQIGEITFWWVYESGNPCE